jgi:hypothetical protein
VALSAFMSGIIYLNNLSFAARAKSLSTAIDQAHDSGDSESELRLALLGLSVRNSFGAADLGLLLRGRRALLSKQYYAALRSSTTFGIRSAIRLSGQPNVLVATSDGALIDENFDNSTIIWRISGILPNHTHSPSEIRVRSRQHWEGNLLFIDMATGHILRKISLAASDSQELELSGDGHHAL